MGYIGNIALKYTNNGLSVIPNKMPKDKSPDLKEWKSYQSEIPSKEQLSKWFAKVEYKGISIVCGKVSGNLEVIDLESYKYDGDLFQEISELIELDRPSLLNSLVIQTSGSGGHHLIYRCKQIQGAQVLARKADEDLLIETRGEGSLIIAAPTPGYKLIQNDFFNIPEITPAQRMYLLEIATSFNRLIKEELKHVPAPAFTSENSPGSEYNHSGDFKNVLKASGWRLVMSRVISKGNIEYWRRPGKKQGISATWNYIPGKFHVFSSNAMPLEVGCYQPFAVYAYLKHNGDFKAAAQGLRGRGFGKPIFDAAIDPEVLERAKATGLLNKDFNEPRAKEYTPIQPVNLDLLAEKSHDRKGFLPDFVNLNNTYHGIHGVTILTGESWTGKSLFALSLAKDFMYKGIPCIYYTLEMDIDSIVKRLVAMSLDQYEVDVYRNFKALVKDNRDQLDYIEQFLYVQEDIILDNILNDIETVRANNTDKELFIIVDYLQLIPVSGSSLKDRIDYILSRIRQIYNNASSEGKISFLVISEITKETGKALAYDLTVAKLKQLLFTGAMGSAGIHYAADLYFTILRHPEDNKAKILFLKNKHGGKLPDPNPIELYFKERGLRYET